mmetsp:Transcript_15908/g.24553  ORF Transcript_15908/g.24553 Transcript_15908/m.24553 type:complete len:121 (+) Transcript_15908:466-828(+)|eukprot:CAMPEP_0170500014 /NCGR_PEP_ID=MMETSP0208-20121228/33428_1 /TAXON_ID=197538 /ORGANISM="Strombidium inclinatum, Strain S3" /LENGTH=120 /DNA_ID=CAMNT_0010777843 /DNA_START=384 /DNA_END=746 /DNA_ORIENTATION=+
MKDLCNKWFNIVTVTEVVSPHIDLSSGLCVFQLPSAIIEKSLSRKEKTLEAIVRKLLPPLEEESGIISSILLTFSPTSTPLLSKPLTRAVAKYVLTTSKTENVLILPVASPSAAGDELEL